MIRLHSVCRSLQRVVVAVVSVCLLIGVGGCSQEQLWPKVAQESAIGDTPHLKPYPAHDGVDFSDMQVAIIAHSSEHQDADRRSAFIESAVNSQGMKGIVMQSHGDTGGQQRLVQDAIARGVSVIILGYDNAQGWNNTLSQARAAGIPVILHEEHTDTSEYIHQYIANKLYAATIVWQESYQLTTADQAKTQLAQTIADVINDEPHSRIITLDTAWLSD